MLTHLEEHRHAKDQIPSFNDNVNEFWLRIDFWNENKLNIVNNYNDGSIDYINGILYRSVVAYSCNTGYSIVGGTTSRACQQNGNWDVSIIDCCFQSFFIVRVILK